MADARQVGVERLVALTEHKRSQLGGIIFVLRTGMPWRRLPRELGRGSGVTCWRRLRDWQQAGVWAALYRRVLNRLGEERASDWSRASLDSLSARAKRGTKRPARTRLTAASLAPKYHLLVDRQGIPLAG